MEKQYSLDEMKRMAFYAVQYASRLERDGLKVVSMDHISHFLDVNLDIIPESEFKPPIEGFDWFKRKKK